MAVRFAAPVALLTRPDFPWTLNYRLGGRSVASFEQFQAPVMVDLGKVGVQPVDAVDASTNSAVRCTAEGGSATCSGAPPRCEIEQPRFVCNGTMPTFYLPACAPEPALL